MKIPKDFFPRKKISFWKIFFLMGEKNRENGEGIR